MEDLFVVVIS